MAHTEWKDTAEPGFTVEAQIAAEFGLRRNPDMRGTDLYSDSGTFVEIKSIGSKFVQYTKHADGACAPHHKHFQITRKARGNGNPLVRPGGVFRACQDSPNSLFVVRCPRKCFYDYKISRSVTIPRRTYYYKSHELMLKLYQLVLTKQVAPRRLYHKNTGHLFETVIEVTFEQLSDIALSREEFVTCVRDGITGIPSSTAKYLWQDLAANYSIPCFRKVEMYKGLVDAFLSTDPVWKPKWWKLNH
jgi:hypothetical protein